MWLKIEGEFTIPSCVRGYHIYKEIWTATIGEELVCQRGPRNINDRYAVRVLKSGVTVGHIPRRLSKIASLFLRRGGSITCTVTGHRRYSVDLSQGGLEVPCNLIFKGKLLK